MESKCFCCNPHFREKSTCPTALPLSSATKRLCSRKRYPSRAMSQASSWDTYLRAWISLARCAKRDLAYTDAAWLRTRCRQYTGRVNRKSPPAVPESSPVFEVNSLVSNCRSISLSQLDPFASRRDIWVYMMKEEDVPQTSTKGAPSFHE